MIASAFVGSEVYPDAENIWKLLIPLIAGALAPTVKDLFSDLNDYFREKILKLRPRKKDSAAADDSDAIIIPKKEIQENDKV